MAALPRLVIAGLSGESGKTLVSLALLLECRRKNIPVRAFKKGPDYIDTSWLEWAAGAPARNLDTYLMGFDRARDSFARNAAAGGFNLVEGNRGLYDGVDAQGTHSTAELAKTLEAPVILVVNATKVTRTVAALVLGCQRLDPDVRMAGVIINQVAGARHERVVREAVESACGIPVLGAIPRIHGEGMLPERHLGLVPPKEHQDCESLAGILSSRVGACLDLDRLLEISRHVPPISSPLPIGECPDASGITIGYLSDSAFSFYYVDNLEALRATGAGLVPISALAAGSLPPNLDALYIGGGFPETHAARLAANTTFLASIRHAAASGLPVYAECGGLMYLSRAVRWRGEWFPMAGFFPFEVEVCDSPQGHGYAELLVDRANPFFAVGTRLRGHEFHYSKIVSGGERPPTACAVMRGAGCGERRDAVVTGNIWAAYTHLHALATPEWARGIARRAGEYRAAANPAAPVSA